MEIVEENVRAVANNTSEPPNPTFDTATMPPQDTVEEPMEISTATSSPAPAPAPTLMSPPPADTRPSTVSPANDENRSRPIPDDTPRNSTPPRSNRRGASDFRFEFRLTVPPSTPDGALQSLLDTLGKILSKIWDSDKHAQILPWYNNSLSNPIKSVSDIPKNMSVLRQYFPRLTPNSKGGVRYTSIRIQTALPPSTLKGDIDWYLRDHQHGLYLAQVQAETVDMILWLLWSSDIIDISVLRPAIEEKLLEVTNQRIPVGLRWRMIQLDRAGRVPSEAAVKALHIDVDREHRNVARPALQAIYSASATEWPLHIRMRAVPLLKDAMNSQVKQDILRLIGRQESFNDEDCGKRKISSWEIKELDFVSSTTGRSLRDHIMGIKQVENDRPLFHSVDHMRFNRSTVIFTCMPSVESEARNMVAGLLTFLKHHYKDEVTEFFTKDAQIRAAKSFWDEEEQCVRNEDDEHVSDLLATNLDEDFIFAPVQKKGPKLSAQVAPERPTPAMPPLQRNTFGEDDDSIQTFRRLQNQDSMSILLRSEFWFTSNSGLRAPSQSLSRI
jgi:hypothetical protein